MYRMAFLKLIILAGVVLGVLSIGDTPNAIAQSCTSNPATLSSAVLSGVSNNKDAYVDIANQTGVPWAMLAGIHYRETNFGRTNPSNGQGIFQFVNGEGGPYPPGPVSESEFRRQLKFMAEKVQTDYVYRGSLNYSKRPLKKSGEDPYRIKDTLFSYNGRASVYANQAETYGYNKNTQPYEGSPYVMNRYDCARKNMGIITQDYGSMDGTDTRYGAYTIYSQLVGESGAKIQPVLTGGDFNPGFILSDADFNNSSAMTVGQIQDFLDSQLYECDKNGSTSYGGGTRASYADSQGNPTPFRCLHEYKEDPSTGANNYGNLSPKQSTYNVATTNFKTSARIIWDASQKYDINPQVVLTLMHTHSKYSPIGDDWPFLSQYREALPFATCFPDCASLSENLDDGLSVLKSHYDANNYDSPSKKTFFHHPDCSTKETVNIVNRSSGALLSVNTNIPNNSALNNVYGSGDACSSYEHRDFWRYYSEWFGLQNVDVSIYLKGIDLNTDQAGDYGEIGVKLSKMPSSTVHIRFSVFSPSNAEIIGDGFVRISPENWNKFEKNILTFRGKSNSKLAGTFENYIIPRAVSSNDNRFDNFPVELIGKAAFLHTNSSSQPVYRLYNSSIGKHFFSANKYDVDNMIEANNYILEGVAFYYCQGGQNTVYRISKGSDYRFRVRGDDSFASNHNGYTTERADFSSSNMGNIPIYWLFDESRSRSMYSPNPNAGSGAGFVNMGVALMACEESSTPTHRTYRPGTGHFYTTSADEKNKAIYELNYRYESIGFYSCDNSGQVVYRLYKRSTGVRFYTASINEKNKAVERLGYEDEGIAFYSCPSGGTDVYQLYKKSTGSRFYTASSNERDRAVNNLGYKYEGVAFIAK